MIARRIIGQEAVVEQTLIAILCGVLVIRTSASRPVIARPGRTSNSRAAAAIARCKARPDDVAHHHPLVAPAAQVQRAARACHVRGREWRRLPLRPRRVLGPEAGGDGVAASAGEATHSRKNRATTNDEGARAARTARRPPNSPPVES